jgi:hypothetical protein
LTTPNESVIEGDPFGVIKQEKGQQTPPPGQVNGFHTRDDVDSSTLAHHHTLGIGHNQGSPGDHAHDGVTSRKVGTGLAITISGAKGGNAALGSLITALKQVMDITDNTTA